MGERDGIGDRKSRHIEDAVDVHENEERPEVLDVIESDHRSAADKVTEGECLFGREMAVRELGGEEHRQNRADRKPIKNERLLERSEPEPPDVPKNLQRP